jgi:predicted nucleic acid-binding protein
VAYFDTAFILKCYVPEPGSALVRRAAASFDQLVASELARAECAAAFHRKRRERTLTRREVEVLIDQFESDCEARVWEFIPLAGAALHRVWQTFATLPSNVVLRSADAIHCATAAEIGLDRIHSNDRHLLGGARYFGLAGIDLTAAD